MDILACASRRAARPLTYTEKFAFRSSHSRTIRCAAFNVSGSLLATGGEDDCLKIWDCLEGKLRFTIVGYAPALSICWTPDPLVLIAGFEDNLFITIVISYSQNQLFVYGVSRASETPFPIEFIALQDGASSLALAGLETVQVWKVQPKQLYKWRKCYEMDPPQTYAADDGHETLVTGVEWLSGSKVLVSYLHHGVMCWDTETRQSLFSIPIPIVGRIAVSPDGVSLAVYNMRSGVDVWDLKTNIQVSRCSHQMGENFPLPVCFIHNGAAVVSGNMTGSVTFWETETGEKISALSHKGECVQAIAAFYSPETDTFKIATGSAPLGEAKSNVRIWATAAQPGIPNPHQNQSVDENLKVLEPDIDALITTQHRMHPRQRKPIIGNDLCSVALIAVLSALFFGIFFSSASQIKD